MTRAKDAARRLRAEEMLADEYADGLHEAQRQARLAIDANVLNAERLAKITALA